MKTETKTRQPSTAEKLEAEIADLAARAKLDSWAEFITPLRMPQEFHVALLTGRPELVRLVVPRPLSEGETADMFALVAGLIETNQALREHAETTAKLVAKWTDAFNHLRGVGQQIERFANFDHPSAVRGVEQD